MQIKGYQCSLHFNLYKDCFLIALPNSLNDTAEAGRTTELNPETVQIMIGQSVLQELKKQKAKLTIVQKTGKSIPNSSKVKSPGKKKSKKKKKTLKKKIRREKKSVALGC